MDYLQEILGELKNFIISYPFASTEEEIHFFKELKPLLASKIIYYNTVYKIEVRFPSGSEDVQRDYLLSETDRISKSFQRNLAFYQYHRTKATYLDRQYFMRGKPDIQIIVDSFYYNISSSPCADTGIPSGHARKCRYWATSSPAREEEIHFFKELKPLLASKIIYYNTVYKIEVRFPAAATGFQSRSSGTWRSTSTTERKPPTWTGSISCVGSLTYKSSWTVSITKQTHSSAPVTISR